MERRNRVLERARAMRRGALRDGDGVSDASWAPRARRERGRHDHRGFRWILFAALAVVSSSWASLGDAATFERCPSACFAGYGRGTCRIDGVCECSPEWTGLACNVPMPSVAKEYRHDGTFAYEHDTSTTAFTETYVRDVLRDGSKGVLYVYALVQSGIRVFEIDPRYPETFTSSGVTLQGWGTGGPRRELTGTVPPPIEPEAGFCGIGISTSCATKHPRAYGRTDSALSRGWYDVYAKLVLMSVQGRTSVITPLNMWDPNNDNRYKFSLSKYQDNQNATCISGASQWDSCVLGSGAPVTTFTKDGYILDAFGASPIGTLVYIATNEDGVSKGIKGYINSFTMEETRSELLNPSLMEAKCPACINKPRAMRMETSANFSSSNVNYVIFAGSAMLDAAQETYYPSIFKVNVGVSDGDGFEMYLDNTTIRVTEACEGQNDARQGRFSTFTAITIHNGRGYVGTSGRDSNCPGCRKRSACIFMFDVNFKEGDGPLAVLVLDGELGERDALSAVVQPGVTPGEKDYMYWTVGSGDGTGKSRIVKIEIGGTDTSSGCVTGCFKRVGTFEEEFEIGGIAYLASERRLFTASSAEYSKYSKYATSVISRVEPTHVDAQTLGTTVTIRGTGFYSPTLTAGLSHSISCRFGHTNDANDGFSEASWSPGTYVSSSELSCVAPSAAKSNSSNLGHSEIQISFDGIPNDLNDPTNLWEKSLWRSGHLYLRYHDPAVIVATKVGDGEAKVFYTGEDANNAPVPLRILGGPFINSPELKCKYGGNVTSVRSAVYISATEIECPVCNVVGGRCANPVGSPLPWLAGGQPADVEVAVSLNGIDFSDSKGTLRLHGPPAGVQLLSGPATYSAVVAAGGYVLGTFQVGLVDINGNTIAYDLGRGGTKGYKIFAELSGPSDVFITPQTASVITSNGVAYFTPELSAAPASGEYTIAFTAADCTEVGVSCAASLSVQALAHFSVEPGTQASLRVTPGRAVENSMISDANHFPTDVILLNASQNVSIGHLTVDIVDVAGSALQWLLEEEITVTASIVTSVLGANGEYVTRSTGAQLVGTLTRVTDNGRAVFSDLALVATSPTGSRVVGSADNITYGEATRGNFSEASKYIVQFKGTRNQVIYVTHSIVRMAVGKPEYLRVNTTYSELIVYAEAPLQLIGEVVIGAYDGGNNFVGANEVNSRVVTVSASSGITLDGTLQVERDDSGVWRFVDLKIVAPVVGDFGLTFSSADLHSVLQVVRVLAGDAGYELIPSQSTLTPVYADEDVPLASFSVAVRDKNGNALGTSDRHSTPDTVAPNRTIQITCDTLSLAGSTVFFTNGSGEITVAGLTARSPKVGSHVLKVVEIGATVSGVARRGKLQHGTLSVSVQVGTVKGFKVISPMAFEFTPSFSETMLASEASAYSAGHTVPLDDFVIVPVDGAGNQSPSGTLPSGISITASMNDTNREMYPYILGGNQTTLQRASVLTTYNSTALYPRNGSLTATTSSAGNATFSGLHLVKPQKGTYNLSFVSSDSSFKSASVALTITPGSSRHLGLLPYCDEAGGRCQTSVNCTCGSYRSAQQVEIHPIVVDVLDGAFNAVGELETKSCEEETCPSRLVHLSPENVTLCRWVKEGIACECAGGGNSSSTASLDNVECASVATLDTPTRSGRAYFDGLFGISPSLGTYSLKFHSSGLLGVEHFFEIILGVASKFVLEHTQASGVFKSSARTSVVNASSPLTGRLYDGGNNFLSSAASGSAIQVRCETAQLGNYPQGINPIVGGMNYAIACGNATSCATSGGTPGVVTFKNIELISPVAGVHSIDFYLAEHLVASYQVTITYGDPTKLVVVNSPSGTYEASKLTKLDPFEIGIADDAGNLLGSLNTNAYALRAYVDGPSHSLQETGRDANITSGMGSALFRGISIGTPQAGDYDISFRCDECDDSGLSISHANFRFSVTLGAASALLIAPAHTSIITGEVIALRTVYSAAKVVKLEVMELRIVDAGLNTLNVNQEVSVSVTRTSAGTCNYPTNMSYTPRTVVSGAAVFEDIVFQRPCTGTYSLTFSAIGLELDSVSTTLTFNPGYPATLDVCTPNSFTRISHGVCRDPTNYLGGRTVDIRSFFVQMTDAGGYAVGSTWDNEPRNITVELLSFTAADGQRHSSDVVPVLRADWDGSLLAVNGGAGWCQDSEDSEIPDTVLITDPITQLTEPIKVYTNMAPEYCRELSYSGGPGRRGTHDNVGIRIENALAGVYHLRIASVCGFTRCPNALYPSLEAEVLEITVVPHVPTELTVLTAPPFISDSDFALVPAPLIAAVDSIGNLCVNATGSVTVSVLPDSAELFGATVDLVDGLATFDALKILGVRDTEYRLSFSSSSLKVSVTSTVPTRIMNCSIVRPNSVLRDGVCECQPGFTSDMSGSTGYTEGEDSLFVETNLTLYKSATSGSIPWISALHPYGICVPCKNGFYKEVHGDAACTSCPPRMNTLRVNGQLREPYQTDHGTQLLGALGHVSKDACHCISDTTVPFESFYRALPLEAFACAVCPVGAKCDGDGVENLQALPGFSRYDRQTLKFRACPYAPACLGGVNSTCLDGGYIGAQCAACSRGFSYHAIYQEYPPRCYSCSEGPYKILNLPIVIVNFIWLAVVVWVIRKINLLNGSQAVSLLKSFVTYLQMTALAKNLDLSWPMPIKLMLLIFEKLSLPDIRSTSLKCALEWNFYDNLLFHESLPLGMVIVLLIGFTVIKYVEELREEVAQARMMANKKEHTNTSESESTTQMVASEKKKSEAGLEEAQKVTAYDVIISWLVVGLWWMYPTLVQFLIEFTQCTGTIGDVDRYFVSDYSLRCAGSSYSIYTTAVAFLFVLHIVGIPYFLLHLARREDITGQNDSAMMAYRMGLFFKGLNVKESWWWEWVILFRKLILIVVVIASRMSAVIGGYTVNCLLQVFLMLHIIYQPHASDRHGRIETFGLLATMATFTSGLIFKQSYDQGASASAFVDLITILLFVPHAWIWYLFVRSLVAQIREEGEEGTIKRALRDLEFENTIVDKFDALRDKEISHMEKMTKESERMRLKSVIGQRLPFADDDLLAAIKRDSALDIRAEHKELSEKLDDLRGRWKERARKRDNRFTDLNERHMVDATERERARARAPSASETPSHPDARRAHTRTMQ